MKLKEKLEEEERLRRFLLGELPEVERRRVEERFVRDGRFFEELLAAEDELLDAYVRGELSPRERERFEARLLAEPRWRERVGFARAMSKSLASPAYEKGAAASSSSPATRPSWLYDLFRPRAPAFALALVVVAIALAALWLAYRGGRGEQATDQASTVRPAPLASPEPQDSPSQPLQEVAKAPAAESSRSSNANESAGLRAAEEGEGTRAGGPRETRKPRAAVAFFQLAPGALRDEGGAATLTIPRGATEVRIELLLERGNDYALYEATLRTAGGKHRWGGRATRPRPARAGGPSVVVRLPAGALGKGDYVLELKGTDGGRRSESVADYSFRVEGK